MQAKPLKCARDKIFHNIPQFQLKNKDIQKHQNIAGSSTPDFLVKENVCAPELGPH